MDVVTRLIQSDDGYLTTNGHRTYRSCVRFVVPDEPYQVIYVLSKIGEHRVYTSRFNRWARVNGTAVCFIPQSWIGKHGDKKGQARGTF